MTTLNEKAKEYAEESQFKSDYPHHPQSGYDGYIAGYTEALRWRDVNVELPPFENVPINERTKYIVKVCTGSMTPKVDIRIWSLSNHRRWIGEMDWVSVTHWRPIETI